MAKVGKSQPLQFSCRASADDHRNPAVQQPVLAHPILCAAEGIGGETSKISETATKYPSGTAIQGIQEND